MNNNMIVCKKLKIKLNNIWKTIDFGIADNDDEKKEMYHLRHSVYTEKNYIYSEKYSEEIEVDDYDKNNKCVYFIAKFDSKLIGTIRIIKDNPLPTEKDYDFSEPKEMSIIPNSQRIELGRFIIIPPDKEKGHFLLRNLVFLVILDVLFEYCSKNYILGGYSFIKTSLANKMIRLKMPFKKIYPYKLRITKGSVLYNYFTQTDDPVIPIYYLISDFKKYIKLVTKYSCIFKKENEKTFILRSRLYSLFSRLFNIGHKYVNS